LNELYLVTGGSGFIGSNIIDALISKRKRVRIIDNFSTGKRENLAFLDEVSLDSEQFELVEGDITDAAHCKKVMEGVDYVIHQAALPSVVRSVEDPVKTNEVNVTGTLNLLWAAKEEGVRKFVYASSSSVYGDTPTLPKKENFKPSPLSPYAVSKLTGEYYCKNFSELYGLDTIALRYFNVFGPRQDPASQYAAVIPKFITAILKGKSPTIFGDGEQSRDFTFVKNVVEANLLAANARDLKERVFNIACGERTTLNKLLMEIKGICKSDINPIHEKQRAGDVRHSLADIELAKQELQYSPHYTLLDGLFQTVQWFVKISSKYPIS
jgi:UDP-N-acetylglucosamine 4-epimerase